MGPRTRSITSSPCKKDMQPREPPNTDRINVLVAPEDLSNDARILSLRHPRDNVTRKFIFCPQKGLFELTKVSHPLNDPRSLLFTRASDGTLDRVPNKLDAADANRVSNGYVCENAGILTATPYDLMFLLLPILGPSKSPAKKQMFQPIDDLLEEAMSENKHFQHVVKEGQGFLQRAVTQICDTVDAGDEKMFRYSEERATQIILSKAKAVVAHGLPASLEERFVRQVLQLPISSVENGDQLAAAASDVKPQANGTSVEGLSNSQSSAASSTVSAVFSEASTGTTVATIEGETTNSRLLQLQRLKVAIDFILATNVSTALSCRLQDIMADPGSPVDFKELQAHLQHIASARAEAIALQSITNFSRKRGHADDEEAAETRAEKKRKQEEEEKKRKANESRGVRDLKKVNVSGMKKMSAFFTKAPLKK